MSEAGFIVDLRLVPIVLAAPFFGPPAGALTFAIAAATRVLVGGAAVIPGLVMLAVAFLGSLALALCRGWSFVLDSNPKKPISLLILIALAAVATISPMLPSVLPSILMPVDSISLPPSAADARLVVMLLVAPLTVVAGLLLRLDERRRDLHRAVQEKNEQLAGIIANLPGVIYRRIWDERRMPRFQMVAGRSRELLGMDPEDLMRDSSLLVDRIEAEDRPRLAAALDAAAEGGTVLEVEFRVRHDDGSIRWLHGKATPRRVNHSGGISDGMLMDITRIKTAEEEAARAKDRADYLAAHDVLTGLCGRLSLIDRASMELGRSSRGVALILLDLVDSGEINERFGHVTGDARLVAVAQRLGPILPHGYVARVAGDMFALLVADGRSEDEIAALAGRALAALSPPLAIEGGILVPVSGRCGYMVAEASGTTVEALIRSAEIALEAARERQLSVPLRYSSAIEMERAERRSFLEDLANAIDTGALTIAWQPIVDGQACRTVGYEALARWYRPEHGLVPADMFVSAAERTGLWRALDQHMLRAACREAVSRADPGWISVNMTSNWATEGDLAEVVAEALSGSGLAPDRLWLEFTERIVIDHADRARALLDDLAAMGVRVAIDDFGAVYSSLSYLHQLPVSRIKLDRGFVADLETSDRARAIVEAVLQLCRRLEISVVGEGVETDAQFFWLQSQGCDYLQGYRFGRPGPAP